MRWIYKKLYPLLSPHLHPRQFGGRQGVLTAHATQPFLDDIDNGTRWEAIFAFDMYHAFDSPPKILIRDVLQRMGTPTKLLLLISTVLEHGSTYIRGTPNEIFGTTHGVKQGCPISCFLFVVVFEIPLRYIHSHNIIFSAYVDDISAPVAQHDGPRVASVVQAGLNLIGCQLNVIKSESLPVPPLPPPHPYYLNTHIRPHPCRCLMISGLRRSVHVGRIGQTLSSIPWPKYPTSCTLDTPYRRTLRSDVRFSWFSVSSKLNSLN